MTEKHFVSVSNYYPGRRELPAKTVFTEAQWIDAGGKAKSLADHIAKGYITEAIQQEPPTPAPTPVIAPAAPTPAPADSTPTPAPTPATAPDVETTTDDGVTGDEDKDNQVSDKPKGLWCFTAGELEPLPIEALNTMYKDTSLKAGLKAPRAYTDKKSLIKKMTSEGNAKD